MKLSALAEVCTILAKYGDDHTGGTRHDFIALSALSRDAVSVEDTARLKELGVFWDEESDGWGAFV